MDVVRSCSSFMEPSLLVLHRRCSCSWTPRPLLEEPVPPRAVPLVGSAPAERAVPLLDGLLARREEEAHAVEQPRVPAGRGPARAVVREVLAARVGAAVALAGTGAGELKRKKGVSSLFCLLFCEQPSVFSEEDRLWNRPE